MVGPFRWLLAVQSDFLIERLGGPKVYTGRKGGHYRLIARHAPYDLNSRSAKRWLEVTEGSVCSLSGRIPVLEA